MSDPGRILRAIERGSLLTVSRLTASYTIQALNELLINTDALLLASALPSLDILVFLLDESSLATAATTNGDHGSTHEPQHAMNHLKVWRESTTHNSLLHIAAAKGQIQVLIIYLQRCPFTLELCNRAGQTALHLAAREGHLEVVTYLLSAGALPDLTDDRGNTALHYAAQWNRRPVVDTLLASHANYLARNESGCLPSDVAFDFSLQREIQDKVRDLAENHKKQKARRRIEKQQQQQQQAQQDRELRKVESEQSLRSTAEGSDLPYQQQQQYAYRPAPLRSRKGSDFTATSMPLVSADGASTIAPSISSVPLSQTFSADSSSSAAQRRLPQHQQGNSYADIYGSGYRPPPPATPRRQFSNGSASGGDASSNNATPLASAAMVHSNSNVFAKNLSDPPQSATTSLFSKSGASAAASKFTLPFSIRHRGDSATTAS